MQGKRRIGAVVVVALFAAASWPAAPAFADPPPWAPAHGWRAKHHHDHDDDDYRAAAPAVAMPYGLAQGTCYRDMIGAALGGAAGGLVGSHIGKSSGRTVATIGGVLLGLFVGGSIGRAMDEADQGCVGAVLEHVPDHRTVVWQGPNQQGYWVTPIRSYAAGNGRYCREYRSQAVIAGRPHSVYGTACRQPDGSWQIQN